MSHVAVSSNKVSSQKGPPLGPCLPLVQYLSQFHRYYDSVQVKIVDKFLKNYSWVSNKRAELNKSVAHSGRKGSHN